MENEIDDSFSDSDIIPSSLEEVVVVPSKSKSWVGFSIDEIHNGKSPWSYNIPLVIPSKYHAVLYEGEVDLHNVPKSRKSINLRHWDSDFVRLPYSPKNLFPIKKSNGEELLVERWSLITEALTKNPITNSEELEAAINKYNTKLPKFNALHFYFNEVLEDYESEVFFEKLLPGIINLALQMPDLVCASIPLLKREYNRAISMSQMQIACIMANAFLCTFPWRRDMYTYPGVNFVRLFTAHISDEKCNPVSEKMKGICHYFRRVLHTPRTGVVTFKRKYLNRTQMPRWDKIDAAFGDMKLHIASSGTIEDNGDGMLQVDFANKYVGGGVLGFGCVQEEIRFVINPELIVSRLFTENLSSTEALVITGVERYSNYSGYAETFVWNGNYEDNTPFDKSGRRQVSITAIDAQHFTRGSTNRSQFEMSSILREVNKAYIGFHSNRPYTLPPVATGNWGCGAFGGNPHLKFLIQLMACSIAKRNMVYYTFGNDELRDTLFQMYNFIVVNEVTCSQLWKLFHKFSLSKVSQEEFYPFLQQAFFDSKSQLSIKSFLSCYKAKNDAGESSNPKMLPQLKSSETDNFELNDEPQSIKKFKQNSPQKLVESSDLDSENLLRIIDEIDGESSSKTEKTFNKSLLTAIDEAAAAKNSNVEVDEKKDESMDVDEVIEFLKQEEQARKLESSPEPVLEVVPSTSKKKITDYFIKQSK